MSKSVGRSKATKKTRKHGQDLEDELDLDLDADEIRRAETLDELERDGMEAESIRRIRQLDRC